MKKLALASISAALFLAACVTINVYFPAAAAERAASEFVGDVLGEPAEEGALSDPLSIDSEPVYWALLKPAIIILSVAVPDAHAQADLEINTPQINAIKAQMAERQRTSLNDLFDTGAIGFTNDGMVAIRDRSAVGLKERRTIESLVADENRDRKAVYREIAVANGHPEWEADIQQTFAREWVRNARPGWYFQDAGGNWVTK